MPAPFRSRPTPTDFAANPDPRCPVVLVLDTSGSMHGPRIAQLNEGLVTFARDLRQDALASRCVEVGIVTFGPVRVAAEFVGAADFTPPTLTASGETPMGAAVSLALALLEHRKVEYRANGIAFFRPWVFLITDGAPTDDIELAAAFALEGERQRKHSFFAVGVQGANLECLAAFSTRPPLRLQGLRFRELFLWLSASMRSISRSRVGVEVPLVDPAAGPHGWASV